MVSAVIAKLVKALRKKPKSKPKKQEVAQPRKPKKQEDMADQKQSTKSVTPKPVKRTKTAVKKQNHWRQEELNKHPIGVTQNLNKVAKDKTERKAGYEFNAPQTKKEIQRSKGFNEEPKKSVIKKTDSEYKKTDVDLLHKISGTGQKTRDTRREKTGTNKARLKRLAENPKDETDKPLFSKELVAGARRQVAAAKRAENKRTKTIESAQNKAKKLEEALKALKRQKASKEKLDKVQKEFDQTKSDISKLRTIKTNVGVGAATAVKKMDKKSAIRKPQDTKTKREKE